MFTGSVPRARARVLSSSQHTPLSVVAGEVGHEPFDGQVVATPIERKLPVRQPSVSTQVTLMTIRPFVRTGSSPRPTPAASTKRGGTSEFDEPALDDDVTQFQAIQRAIFEVRRRGDSAKPSNPPNKISRTRLIKIK